MQEEMEHAELVAAAPLAQESMEVEIKAKRGLQMAMECEFKVRYSHRIHYEL